MNKPKPAEGPESTVDDAIGWIKSGIAGFLIFFFMRTFLVQTFTIISGSMAGTLLIGDFLVLNKIAYGAQVPGTEARLPGYAEPTRGDIVVFRGHHEPLDLVKRLVGMPGDTLEMRGGILYRDGVAQDEPYVRRIDPDNDRRDRRMRWQAEYLVSEARSQRYDPTRDNWGPLVVPEGRYFMLGDNRDASLDSRYWGFIQETQINGRAVALYFSYSNRPIGRIPLLRHVRWDRVGEILR